MLIDQPFREIKGYLSRPDVRSTLGVDESVPQNFSLVSWEVNSAFMASMDHVFPNQFYIAALLERGIRALIYTGVNDFACNWVGRLSPTLLHGMHLIVPFDRRRSVTIA